jgi:hypothetical protein
MLELEMDADNAERTINESSRLIKDKKFREAIQLYDDWIQRNALETTSRTIDVIRFMNACRFT